MLYSDHPRQFTAGFIFGTESGSLTVKSVRHANNRVLMAFEGTADRTAAEGLSGTQLYMDASERRSLDPGEFWPSDLEGMSVEDTQGEPRGTVLKVSAGGSQDRLLIETGAGEVLVPFVEALVPTVDLERRVVVVDATTGVLDPYE